MTSNRYQPTEKVGDAYPQLPTGPGSQYRGGYRGGGGWGDQEDHEAAAAAAATTAQLAAAAAAAGRAGGGGGGRGGQASQQLQGGGGGGGGGGFSQQSSQAAFMPFAMPAYAIPTLGPKVSEGRETGHHILTLTSVASSPSCHSCLWPCSRRKGVPRVSDCIGIVVPSSAAGANSSKFLSH